MRNYNRPPRLNVPAFPMPDFMRQALNESGLMKAYEARPEYQRNEYIRWVTGSRYKETRLRRLEQMLKELEKGDAYLNTPWDPEDEKQR